jgi:uroporphyrinogen-III synthase
MANAGFRGLRVLTLESRRAKLIRNCGGEPTVVPAMRKVPLESNQEALGFAASLLRDELDVVIFLTGAGIRSLLAVVETKYKHEDFLAALRKVKIAWRGPKPSAVLQELKVPITVSAPESCTWREMVGALQFLFGRHIRIPGFSICRRDPLPARIVVSGSLH